MSEIVEFLNAQYDRLEKRERGKFTVPYRPDLRCPECGQGVNETIHEGRADHARFEPCGHTIPNVEYVKRYARSSPDPLVLADIESKRRILNLHRTDGEDGPDPICNVCLYTPPCETVRALAAPFSGEPGYKEEWSA